MKILVGKPEGKTSYGTSKLYNRIIIKEILKKSDRKL
jgi:hypothetical protein